MILPENKKYILTFWTDDNPMSDQRKSNFDKLSEISKYPVILIDTENVADFILSSDPLPEAYQYLSATHRADYLRAYFMYYYGGGYSDIKLTTGSWESAFADIENNNILMCGYPEFSHHQVAHPQYVKYWNLLIGCGGFICKSQTQLTSEWYNTIKSIVISKTGALKQYPATHPQECSEGNGIDGVQPHGVRSNYPIEWNEILGRVLHPLVFQYRYYISRAIPRPIITNYR